MGYREGTDFDWATAMETAAAMSFAPTRQTPGSFTRGDVVEMTARALAAPMAKTGRTLAEHLAQLGALDLQLAYAQELIPT